MSPKLLRTAVSLLLGFFVLVMATAGEATAVPAPPDLAPYPWVYLRDGRPVTANETLISVIAVGDVLLGRGVAAQPDPLGDVAPWLRAADVTLGNLEGVIINGRLRSTVNGEGNPVPGSRIALFMPATAVFPLQHAGFDLLGLANNHSLDAGAEGLQQTAVRLRQSGLIPLGLNENGSVAPEIRIANNIRLALLAFNTIPDPAASLLCRPASQLPCPLVWDAEGGPAAIAAAKAQADAVIVSVHWGLEYEARPSPTQERLAQAMLDAGADLVVGHHPHVAQPLALSGDRVVAYSLGNFVFDQETAQTRPALALHAFFDSAGLRAVQVLPIQAGLRPRLLAPNEAVSLLTRVLPPPPRLAFACGEEGCAPAAAPQVAQGGRFFSGQIDLTGDGVPETVRQEGERVVVFQDGTAVWRSPAEWRVVDVALGDPNDDGRYEIMLAIWRRDGAGYERSQPYIVGYRGGAYELLWGGRPVVDPIQELELGDVDGDGIEELVVLVQAPEGTAVAVWQWQGWTFSLQWRSAPGDYTDLALAGRSDEQPIITVSQNRFWASGEGQR